MKRTIASMLMLILVISTLLMTGCSEFVQQNTKQNLQVPTNVRVDEDSSMLMWNSVEYASGYTVMVNETTFITGTNSFSLNVLKPGDYTISVKANGDGVMYVSSAYSNAIGYKRIADSGTEYEDDVVAAFREFDEINTKNSFLGYGIDIINASAITSKNVLMTYPIFDMDKLMNENLLKSNEHYNSFEAIEAATIEAFTQNMGNSTSITAGANVSAKGSYAGVDASASASLTSGLTTAFTKTSESVESQYFLEIIAENQSYWLVLQTSEQRYKDLLSEEFKADLYNTAITPAQLFMKYGTHMLTSVAMGGNICMYYTMYSYDKSTANTAYAEVSSTLKTNVEVAYGGASAGAGTENSFNSAYSYQAIANQYGIHVDKKIVSAGGGSFGINNEMTLYENYHDWQKSLDIYPVVIGIKDANSLYPIWNLLDLNVEGASERYQELYSYFQEYGEASYNNLCETYAITPSVAPSDISNITVGTHMNYAENQTVNVKAGETLRVSFDVEPHNANKYLKTFAVDNTSLATIDDTGLLVISPTAPGGSYIKVMIAAGPVSKQITLYVTNTYNVTFNTRVTGLEVDSIIGILEGYTIEAPQIEREGWVLEGWYTDAANTNKFDFENDSVTSHMTLYAKWVAIKPIVTFETDGGSVIDAQILAYNGVAAKPKDPVRSGYTFGGWYADEDCTAAFDFATQIAKDLTLYAKWERNDFEVTFVTNGGTPIAPVTTSIEDAYKIAEPITAKQYYVLDGWYLDEYFTQKFYFESEVTKDITLYASWIPAKATIRFVDTDGMSPVYDAVGFVITSRETNVEKDFKIAAPMPEKEGYSFAGWYLNGILIDLSSYADFKPCEEGYTLVAKWNINSYTIAFDCDGGSAVSSITKNYGASITKPLNPTKIGYTFMGWSEEIPETMPAENLTITAIWSVNQYTITFDTNGGDAIEALTLDYGTNIKKPENPTKLGYTFAGWNRAIPETMPAENITITAAWTINSYTITFLLDGEEYAKETYEFGEAIAYPEVMVEGYTFSGWKYGHKELPTTMPAQNIEIIGTLIINNYTVQYYVDGALHLTQTYAYGAEIRIIDQPTAEGKTFSGWICSTLGYMPTTMPACDLRIDGGFDQTTFYIHYYVDDILVKTQPIIKGHGITPFVPEAREGYSFSGWLVKDGEITSLMPETMPSKDISAYGSFSVNQYTIIFNTEGGNEIDSITQDYGTAIVKPANPTKTGYTFAGWDGVIPAKMPAENLTITAKWTINRYTITFDTKGGNVIAPITQDYGTLIVAPVNPERVGHTFVRWDKTIPVTMPAEDMTIAANWSVNQYTITFNTDGGNEIDSITQDYGTAITKTTAPSKKGYTFVDWDQAIPATMPAENLTITAKWMINRYTITFDTKGGNVIAPITQDYDTVIVVPANPTKTGHTFAGWDKVIPLTMPAEDLTIAAKDWIINQYTITFDTKGGSKIDSITQNYGTAIVAPANPTKIGYQFVGWDRAIPATMPAENMTVSADWKLKTSAINYKKNDSGLDGEFEIYGNVSELSYFVSTINAARAITYSGKYAFQGWYTQSSGGLQIADSNGKLLANISGYTDAAGKWICEQNSITLYARWKINTYQITFVTNGGSAVNTQSYLCGDITQKPKDPTKSGYNFDGWVFDVKSFAFGNAMPASNIVATAKWVYKSVYYDSGYEAKKIDASHTYDYDSFDISALTPFMKAGYKLRFDLSVYMWEENEGYQEIYLVNSNGAYLASIGDSFAHGNGGKDGEWWEYFTFTVDGENCTNAMTLRYGAHGEYSDDWYRARAIVNVTVILE